MDKYAVFEGLIKTAVIDCGVKELDELPDNIQRIIKLLDGIIEAERCVDMYYALNELSLYDCNYIICPLIDEIRFTITSLDSFSSLLYKLIKHDYIDGMQYILNHKRPLNETELTYKLSYCIEHDALKCANIIINKLSESSIRSTINSVCTADRTDKFISYKMYKLLEKYFTKDMYHNVAFIVNINFYDCHLILKDLMDNHEYIATKDDFIDAIANNSINIVKLLHLKPFKFDEHSVPTRLVTAIDCEAYDVAMYIISTGYYISRDTLVHIVRYGSVDILSFTLQMHPDLIQYYLPGHHIDYFNYCIIDWPYLSDMDIIKKLKILEKYGVSYMKSTVFIAAISHSRIDIVEYLMKKKKIPLCQCTKAMSYDGTCITCRRYRLTGIIAKYETNPVCLNAVNVYKKYL